MSAKLQLPFVFAKRHGALIESANPSLAVVACRPGLQPAIFAEIRRFAGRPVSFREITPVQFDGALSAAYQSASSEAMQLMEDLTDGTLSAGLADAVSEIEDLLEQQEDAPVIRLINALLVEAIKERASDIHIETFEKKLIVRFRIDGVLQEIMQPKRALAPLLVSRIKVMAKLDIAEKRLPQDGRISLRLAGRDVDIRVATIPVSGGERVVMRLLDKQSARLNLEQLGMSEPERVAMDRILKRPHGVLLVTGPTGSGKTTTLYAGLTQLHDGSRNILTIEDPIEYHLEGIGQTQVNTKVEMTFARGLRAILRQDPDIVMIGEIRDGETAEIAVQASLTGHLVLSTLHTNSAIGAVARLHDMGVESFLLSSSLIGIAAQRLVRKLCPECRTPYQADAATCALLGLDEAPTLYRANGCSACKQLGYRGRTGIYEVIEVDEAMRALIHSRAGEQEFERHVRQKTPSIWASGKEKILAGVTTLEEVLRVTQEE